MSLEDQAKGAMDQATGKAKELGGQVTGDKQMEDEGKAEGLMGKAKQMFGDAKDKTVEVSGDLADKASDAVDDIKEKF